MPIRHPSDNFESRNFEAKDSSEKKGLTDLTFEQLFKQYSGILKKYSFKLTNNYKFADPVTKAEDIYQESLLKAWKNKGALKGPDKFLAWMRTIITNSTIAEWRAEKTKAYPDRNTANIELLEPGMEIADPESLNGHLIDTIYVKKDLIPVLKETLSPEEFELFWKISAEKMTYEELQKELFVPMGTIKSRISRLKGKINKALKLRDITR